MMKPISMTQHMIKKRIGDMAIESSKQKEGQLGNAITNYSQSLISLREFVALISPFLNEARNKFIEENINNLTQLVLPFSKLGPTRDILKIDESLAKEKFGADIRVEVNEDGKTCSISIQSRDGAGERFEKAVTGMHAKTFHSSLLYRSSLISLVSTAEWFLSQVLRQYFELYPDAAGIKEK